MSPGPKARVDIDRLLTLREAGGSYRKIARELETTEGNVYWHCLKAGIPRQPHHSGGPQIVGSIRQIRRYSEDEDREISMLRLQGHSHAEIGRRINRRSISVAARLYTLAIYEEAAA